MKVVIAEPVSDKLAELIRAENRDWTVYSDSPKDKVELIHRLEGASAATSYSIKYDDEIFTACPELKFLAIPAVGAEYFVDVKAAKKHNVTVTNCPGYNARAVAEIAVGLAIAAARNIPGQQKDLQRGLWDESSRGSGFLLDGSKVGIIGNGNVATMLRQLLSGWSVEITSLDSKSTSAEVDQLVAESDILFLCCPLNENTRGMISSERIGAMKPNAILVNVARGAVVDEDALFKALQTKQIFSAGLDVFIDEPEYGEPIPESIQRFVELDNVIVSPHLAGSSRQSKETLGQMIYDNLASYLDGNPQNIFS